MHGTGGESTVLLDVTPWLTDWTASHSASSLWRRYVPVGQGRRVAVRCLWSDRWGRARPHGRPAWRRCCTPAHHGRCAWCTCDFVLNKAAFTVPDVYVWQKGANGKLNSASALALSLCLHVMAVTCPLSGLASRTFHHTEREGASK
jgi:hypothetical protein